MTRTDDPSSFAAHCRAPLDRAREILADLVAVRGERTAANTLEPYNEMWLHIRLAGGRAGLFSEVHPDEAIRDVARECEQDVDKLTTALRLDRDLYEAFEAFDTADLDARARRLVEHTLRDFRRAGVDRDEATRARIEEIDERLTVLGQQFSKNIVEDVRTVRVPPEALEGLPEDFIASHPPGDDGKVAITTDYPDYFPFLSYSTSTEHRRALYLEFKSRGGEANEEILAEILGLRAEKARMLGFDNWADYVTDDKMIESAANAAAFIERVATLARPRAEKDYAELLARKQKDEPGATAVEDYEKTYYENKVKSESYSYDPQAVRPYFPYAQVEAGLLDITSRIYGVTYERVPDADVWHEDVDVYDVVDSGGEKLGRIYLDMHPRDGKYKHAAQFPYVPGVAGTQLPEGVLVCNFPNPRHGPALMEHGQVVTLFHEFGHLMHHVFGGRQKWVDQSGVATEWDFVEAPSQMFEEWAWRHETLASFARHHETGEVIPEDLVAAMRRADKLGIGVLTVQQMFYAAISLRFHTADPRELDMLAEVRRLQEEYTPFRFVEGTRFHASFGHLNGYSAMYYTYMWSLVIAKDLLTPFEEHGLMSTEWTHRYRDAILAAGGTKDAADLVADFLGRAYSFEAFERYLSA